MRRNAGLLLLMARSTVDPPLELYRPGFIRRVATFWLEKAILKERLRLFWGAFAEEPCGHNSKNGS